MCAANCSHVDIVQLLSAHDKTDFLYEAAKHGHLGVVRLILREVKTKRTRKQAREIAKEQGLLEVLWLLYRPSAILSVEQQQLDIYVNYLCSNQHMYQKCKPIAVIVRDEAVKSHSATTI